MKWFVMLTTPLMVLWLMATMADGQADGSFWWLKDRSTTTNAPTEVAEKALEPPPCECVKYYMCVNGTIDTSGAGIIDIRLGGNKPAPAPPKNRANVPQCPGLYDVCCSLPDALTTTTKAPAITRPTLPPDTPCECVSFINCTEERLVSDGGGKTSLELYGFSYSHSACPITLTVCCALGPNTTTTEATTPVVTPQPTVDGSHCECVEPNRCDPSGTIITSGIGLMDLRTTYRDPNPHIRCEDSFKMCCNKPPPEITETTHSPLNATTTEASTTPAPTLPSCGTRNQMGIATRIQGFENGESQFGEFPWVAAILRQQYIMDKMVHLFVGGGTLIHPRIVVTAAHKLSGARPASLLVRLGEWDTQKDVEPLPSLNVEVEEIVGHPKYDPRSLFNDVALLILKEEVPMAEHIKHICIADDVSKVDGSGCVINGWGKNGFEGNGTYQVIMKSLTLPLVDHSTCQTQLRSTRLGPYFRLHNTFVCAGGELGKDACTGDGGGPLACPRLDDPNRYLLVGITAWGIGCGQDGIPGVYASIPATYEWIRNETYRRFPEPITTTPTTTTATSTTIVAAESLQEEYEYADWDDTRANEREERERRREERERRREEKQREKEEKKRKREERRRQREERRRQRGRI